MLDWSKSPSIKIASRIIKQGGVIAYPTEAVWGLGCEPFDRAAVYNILALKNRSPDKGLILIAADIAQFDFILHDLPSQYIEQLQASWPGPYTWIVPHRNRVPQWVSGQHSGIALRVSNHPLVQALCRCYGGPIVSTSANPQGKTEAKSQWQVSRFFSHRPELHYVTKGVIGKQNRPSQIRDLLSNRLLRQ